MTCASCVGRVERALARRAGRARRPASTWRRRARRCCTRRAPRADLGAAAAGGGAARRLRGADASTRSRGRARRPAAPRRRLARRAGRAAQSAPLALPMAGDLFGAHWMLPAWWQFAARHAGAVLARRALLPRRLEGAARRQRQHGPAGRAGHQRGLWPEPGRCGGATRTACRTCTSRAPRWSSRWCCSASGSRRAPSGARSARSRRCARCGPTPHACAATAARSSVPLAEVRVGDEVVVRPGERVPVDGAADRRRAATSTNRCSPARACRWRASAGERGHRRRDQRRGPACVLRTTAVGAETTLARIVRWSSRRRPRRRRSSRLVDRVSAVFVPVVLARRRCSRCSAGAGPTATGRGACVHAVSVLVIACPCALGPGHAGDPDGRHRRWRRSAASWCATRRRWS